MLKLDLVQTVENVQVQSRVCPRLVCQEHHRSDVVNWVLVSGASPHIQTAGEAVKCRVCQIFGVGLSGVKRIWRSECIALTCLTSRAYESKER